MTGSLFFWVSKLVWMFIRPDFLLVAFAATGLLFLFFGAQKKAKWILGTVVLAMLIITVVPLGTMLMAPLEHRFATNPELPAKVDGIIMLGGAENNRLTWMWDQPEIKGAADRYIGFARLVRKYPDAVHLFTGGSGDVVHQEYKDADTARRVFMDMGLDTTGMIFEGQSRNTFENGVNAKKLARPEPGQVWVLVTTAAHMPRAVGVFNQIGWPVIPWPVDHCTRPDRKVEPDINFSGHLEDFVLATTEWAGLVAYYIAGKTNALLPNFADYGVGLEF